MYVCMYVCVKYVCLSLLIAGDGLECSVRGVTFDECSGCILARVGS